MIETLIPGDAFLWTVIVMTLSSLTVIGLLLYGRYTRKKKDVMKEAVKDYEETKEFIDPDIKFDPSVALFWIGGSFLNILFSLCILFGIITYLDIIFDPPMLYVLMGFGISFFVAIPMYLITQFMANGILDAKAVKRLAKTIIGSDEAKKVVSAVCAKIGVADKETVERVYEKVRDHIAVAEYSELTPDEILLISKAINEKDCGIKSNASESAEKAEGLSEISQKPDGIFQKQG